MRTSGLLHQQGILFRSSFIYFILSSLPSHTNPVGLHKADVETKRYLLENGEERGMTTKNRAEPQMEWDWGTLTDQERDQGKSTLKSPFLHIFHFHHAVNEETSVTLFMLLTGFSFQESIFTIKSQLPSPKGTNTFENRSLSQIQLNATTIVCRLFCHQSREKTQKDHITWFCIWLDIDLVLLWEKCFIYPPLPVLSSTTLQSSLFWK